jgi:hypothetical protein
MMKPVQNTIRKWAHVGRPVYYKTGYIKKLLRVTGHGKMPVSSVSMIKKRLQKERSIPV